MVGESVGAVVGLSVGVTVGDTVGDSVWIVIARNVSSLTILSTVPESDAFPMVMSMAPLDMAAAILRTNASSSTESPYNSTLSPRFGTDDRRERTATGSQPQLLLVPPAKSSWLTVPSEDAMNDAL